MSGFHSIFTGPHEHFVRRWDERHHRFIFETIIIVINGGDEYGISPLVR